MQFLVIVLRKHNHIVGTHALFYFPPRYTGKLKIIHSDFDPVNLILL